MSRVVANTSKAGRPSRRRIQFGILGLLILTTMVGAGIRSWQNFMAPYERQAEAVSILSSVAEVRSRPGKPGWIGWIAGKDFVQATMVRIHAPNRNDQHIDVLPDLVWTENLYFEGGSVRDEWLREVGTLKNLRRLSLRRSEVSNTGLRQIAGLRNLEVIDVSRTAATADCLEFLPSGVKEIRADERVINARLLPHLERFPNWRIKRLDLGFQSVTDSQLALLAQAQELEYLSLRGNPITDASISLLASFESLLVLDLSGTSISEQGLAKYLSMVQGNVRRTYTELPTGTAKLASERGVTVWYVDEDEMRMRALLWLRSIGISAKHSETLADPRDWDVGYALDVPGISMLATLSTLSELRIYGPRLIEEANIHHLNHVPNLEKLTIVGGLRARRGECSDWWLLRLTSDCQLRELTVWDSQIEGWCLQFLKELPKLQTLDLSGNPIDSGSLSNLGGYPKLRELRLQRTGLTAEGLQHLERLDQLRVLDLRGCDLTSQQIERLQDRLPDTQVLDGPVPSQSGQ